MGINNPGLILPHTVLCSVQAATTVPSMLQAHLLQKLRPTDFRSFGAFVAWRQDTSQLLTAVLGLAAAGTSKANNRLAASCRTLMVGTRS